MNKIICFFLMALLFCVQGCTVSEDTAFNNPATQQFRFTTKAAEAEVLGFTQVNAYVFSAGTLVKIFNDMPVNGTAVAINVPQNAQIYFLAGFTKEPVSLGTLEINKTTLGSFLSLCTDQLPEASAGSATLFYTGYYGGSNTVSETVHEIQMTRSVARIDLDTSSDPLIKINRIKATDVLRSSVLFGSHENVSAEIAKCMVEKSFDTPMSGKAEGVMHLFESPSPVSLTLYGTYNDVPIVVNVSIANLKRNSVYTVKINNVGTSVNGSIQIKPWETGGTVTGNPDLNTSVSIDLLHTTSDEGIKIDEKKNHVLISENGGEIQLALAAETSLSITSVEGNNSRISIGAPVPSLVESKLITTIPIVASKQNKGSLPYQVRINLKGPLTQNAYDFVTINVDGNQQQIPTVSFNGLEIMAFNTTGMSADDQVYLPEGTSVNAMYTDHWGDCTGKMFQYGRGTVGYFPYQSMGVTPNIPNDLTLWDEASGAPCPSGFRMLTRDELRKIMPPSKTIPIDGSVPINYYIDGKVAKMQIITSDKRVSMGGVSNITPRFVRLTCEGDTLNFPMGGYKWISAGGRAQNIGERFYVMAANREGLELARVYGYNGSIFQNEHNHSQPRQLNNYNFVRCVKK